MPRILLTKGTFKSRDSIGSMHQAVVVIRYASRAYVGGFYGGLEQAPPAYEEGSEEHEGDEQGIIIWAVLWPYKDDGARVMNYHALDYCNTR